MKILMIGSFGHPTGFSRAFGDYCHALKAVGADFQIHPLIPFDWNRIGPRDRALLEHLRAPQEYAPVAVAVVHTIPQYAHIALGDDQILPEPAGKDVLITTWECSKLPVGVPETLCAAFNEIVVPSQYNVDIFTNSDVPPEGLSLIPHAFDPKWWWDPAAEREVLKEKAPDGVYTFYNIGTWCERKNPIGLLKAYLTEFTSGDRVRLVLVHGHNPEMVEEDLKALKTALGLHPDDYPEVVVAGASSEHEGFSPGWRSSYLQVGKTDEAIRALHYGADCFVTAARSEGFGLGAFEAAVAGAYVIAPDYSGHVDFLRPLGHALYPCRETPVVDPLWHPELGTHGRMLWGEPDLCGLKREMRDAYARGHRGASQEARSQNLRDYTLEAVGQKLLEVFT